MSPLKKVLLHPGSPILGFSQIPVGEIKTLRTMPLDFPLVLGVSCIPKAGRSILGGRGLSPGQLPLEGCTSPAFQLSEPALG